VGSFTATTHSIGTADFMAGNYRFTRDGATGAIVNEGHIQAALGGYVALLAPEVRNHGVVLAQMGAVALAAGEAYQLSIQGSRLASIEVTPATISTLVENGQAVLAPEGWIVLSAKAAAQLEASVINTGQVSANSLVERGGRIVLESTGSVSAGGSIQANSAQGQGGSVTVTGEHITLSAGSDIQATGATGGGTDAGKQRRDIGAIGLAQRLEGAHGIVGLLRGVQGLAVHQQRLGEGRGDGLGRGQQALDRVRHVVRLVDHVGRGKALRLAHLRIHEFIEHQEQPERVDRARIEVVVAVFRIVEVETRQLLRPNQACHDLLDVRVGCVMAEITVE